MAQLGAAFLESPVEVAVLDRGGIIRQVNEAWRRFARENEAPELAERSVGLNYVELCRTASGPESTAGREAAAGIEAVLSGRLPSFALDYPCNSPTRRRYFRLDVVPVAGGNGGALVTHTKLAEYKRSATPADEVIDMKVRPLDEVVDETGQITEWQTIVRSSLTSGAQRLHTPLAERRDVHGTDGELPPRFVGLLDALADPVALYGTTGRMVRVNRAYVEIFALDRNPEYFSLPTAEQIQILHVRDAVTGRPINLEDLPVTRALRGEALTGASAMDVRVRALDGREVDVSVSANSVYADGQAGGPIVGAFVTLRDVTERRRMERELVAWASRMEATLGSMQDGVTLTDAQGRILLSNPAFTKLFAIGRDPTLLSRSPADRGARLAFAHPDDGRPLTADEMPATQALQGKELAGSHALELHARALDGQELNLSVSAAPLHDGDGHVVGAVAVYRDVTKRRELERERRRMMDLVAHELRHPLAILQIADELIRRDFAPIDMTATDMAPRAIVTSDATRSDKLLEMLDFVSRGIAEMERLVQDLVDAAHMESGHMTLEIAPTDLAELVRRVADEEMRLRGNVIHVEAPKRRVMVLVDWMRMAQVLTNLLTNAYKYSPAGAPVRLRLTRRRGEARVEIHDEGPGIPREAQVHLFERFYRVQGVKAQQGAEGGLGLGLYVCFQVVRLHGGQIGVESTVGHGSTFWFTIPLARKPNGT